MALLIHEIFAGADGRSRILIFAEASGMSGLGGGGSGLLPSSSNVEIAIAATAMAGLSFAATLERRKI